MAVSQVESRNDRQEFDVTVIIATFNRCKYVTEAVESFLNQTLRAREILVINDGSTDDTETALKRFEGKIRYISRENGGKSKALNQALREVKTKYVWFFDDDDAVYPEALSHLAACLEKNPGNAFCFGSYDVSTAQTQLLNSQITKRAYPHRAADVHELRLMLYRDHILTMSGSIIRTEAVRAAGGFDESMLRSQDHHLMVRIASQNEFSFCGTNVFIVRHHEGIRGTNKDPIEFSKRISNWVKYNHVIGYYLYSELPLSAFLPKTPSPESGPIGRRLSFLLRASSIANKLPARYAIADIISAFVEAPNDALSDRERVALSSMFNDDFVPLIEPQQRFLSLYRTAFSRAGSEGLALVSRSLFWIASKQKNPWARVRLTLQAAPLFILAKTFTLIHK